VISIFIAVSFMMCYAI